MSAYSARIRAARNYAGLTQIQLAEALGVDEQTIKRRESPAGNEPKKGERIAIASICGVPPEFMEIGFGEITRDELLDRLARIEQAVGVTDSDSLDALAESAEELRPDKDAAHPGTVRRKRARG